MPTLFPLQAKLRPPRLRDDMLVRPRLAHALAQALFEARVVALVAPAGCGKTVALAQAVAALPAAVVTLWVTLEPHDDLERLLACLAAAMEPLDPTWRQAPEALVAVAGSGPDGRRDAALAFAVSLEGCGCELGVVVLEDLHHVDDPQALKWLATWVRWLPQGWTVALTSRGEPALPLARWRAAGELAEFRAADLALRRDEVAALLKVGADVPEVTELLNRTQGWPAGVGLLRAHGVPRGQEVLRRQIDAYVSEEVLGGLPPPMVRFLLRSSILPELTAERAAIVSGDPLAAQWLAETERLCLLGTPLDGDEPALRLHDLLRDWLQQRLQRLHAAELPALYGRAAATEPDPLREVRWWQQAGDWRAAEGALERHAPALLSAGAQAALARLVEGFPAPWQARSPTLAMVQGVAAAQRYEWLTMRQALHRAGDGFDLAGDRERAVQARAMEVVALLGGGQIDLARRQCALIDGPAEQPTTRALQALARCWATGALGPVDGPARHLDAMTDELLASSSPQAWIYSLPSHIFIGRPSVHAALGRWCEAASVMPGEPSATLAAHLNIVSGWVRFWGGERAAAQSHVDVSDRDLRWLGRPRGLELAALTLRTALAMASDDAAAANDGVDSMIDAAAHDAQRRDTWRPVFVFIAVQHAGLTGQSSRVRSLADELAVAPTAREWPLMRHAREAAMAWTAFAGGDFGEAAERFSRAMPGLIACDLVGMSCQLRIGQTLALLRSGRQRQAGLSLMQAWADSGSGAEPGAWWLAGPSALAELAEAEWGGVGHERIVQTLGRWQMQMRATALAPRGGPANGLQALTPRETEVLSRLACGDSNKHIARELALSPHTVKRHVANILDKLGVGSRGRAAALFHSQGHG